MFEFIHTLLRFIGLERQIELIKALPDSEFKFRVVRSYNKFYVEVMRFPDAWDMVGFNEDGDLTRYVYDAYETGNYFDNAEEACSLANRLSAGERHFPEYDRRGYAIIDCSCEKPA